MTAPTNGDSVAIRMRRDRLRAASGTLCSCASCAT
jgi:hypothetical protein